MTTYKVEAISGSPKTKLGEGPHWNIDNQSLYYIDLQASIGTVHRYVPIENKVYTATIESTKPFSFIIPIKGQLNQYAVAYERTVAIIEWDGVSDHLKILRTVFSVEQSDTFKNNKFNDAKADSTGRFYGGTMTYSIPDPLGSLYSYKSGEEVKNIRQKVKVSNGLTWNSKEKKFYYIDTQLTTIFEYDWDETTGVISNEKVLINFKGLDHSYRNPDGMTIDSDGNLYVAMFNGAKVVKVNPKTGNVELDILIPAEQTTSVAFGGPNLDELYVTCGSNLDYGPIGSEGGSLLRVTGLGVKGVPMNKLDL